MTGAPGAGKSLVAKYFESKGATIISGDDTGREVIEIYPETLNKLVKTFGNKILNQDGSLNRKSLGSIVFGNSRELKKLNAIVHPYLLRLLKLKIRKYKKSGLKGMIVVDAALIFEWGIDDWFDYVLVVTSNRANRMDRMIRSGLTKKEAINRIGSQIPQRIKAAKADFIIENNGNKINLRNKVYSLVKMLSL